MIVDLHCDLLSYLAEKKGRCFSDPQSRASHPHMVEGRVKVQTLAIYTEQEEKNARQQVALFKQLLREHPSHYAPFSSDKLPDASTHLVHVIAAFENAAGFSDPREALHLSLGRLESYCAELGPIFYISLTWNGENRFGGGVGAHVGLKEDGKRLLEWMDGRGIALDLSHASDHLAYESIDFIERKGFSIPLIASHSNFRAITDQPRNLPEEIAKEIIRRKGLIGLNLFAPFIHASDPLALIRHVEYALDLGGKDALSFGADFFCDSDFSNLKEKYQVSSAYFPEYANASAYPRILALLKERLRLNEKSLAKIAYENALCFLKEKMF